MLKRALEHSGIDAEVEPEFSGPPVGGMFPVGGTMPHKQWRILAQESDSARARDVISNVTLNEMRQKDEPPRWAALMQRVLGLISLILLLGALFISAWAALQDAIKRFY